MIRHPEFKYVIENEDLWIRIGDLNDSGWGRNVFDWTDEEKNAGPIELLLRIKDETQWTIEEVGKDQYRFKEDYLDLIYQWDDLFGFVVIIQSMDQYKLAVDFLVKYFG